MNDQSIWHKPGISIFYSKDYRYILGSFFILITGRRVQLDFENPDSPTLRRLFLWFCWLEVELE